MQRLTASNTFAIALAACVCAVAPGVALAQDAKQIKRIEDMNRAAMEDYDLLEFESAKKQLNEALVLVKKHKLQNHAVSAKTHMNLGIVYGGGLADTDTALLEFIAALEIDPEAKLDPAYKNKQLQNIFDQARSTVGVTGGGNTKGGGGGTPDPDPEVEAIEGMQHSPLDEAPGGKPIPIMVKVGPDVKAKQVVLYYRGEGIEDFTPEAMQKSDPVTYVGEIPADATTGNSLHYYIEAKNDKGKVMATTGSNGSPNIVILAQVSGGGGGGDEDDEDPLAKIGRGGGGGPDPDATITKGPRRPGKKTVFINASVGSGGGFVTGKTEVSAQKVRCCFAPAPFHIFAELGVFLNPRTTLSGYLRMGFIPGANASFMGANSAKAAPAGFARLAYSLDPRGAGLMFHGDVGFGFIRHQIPLDKGEMTDVEGETDTSAMGPLFVGGGAKYEKPFGGGTVRFVADANVLAGIPVTDKIDTAVLSFGVNVDLNLGLIFAF